MKAVFLDRNTFSPSIDLPAPAGVTDWQVHDATPNDTATVVERLRGAQIAISNKVLLTRDIIAQSPDLKLVQVAATGVNNVDADACKDHGVRLANVAGYSTTSVAEHTFAAILAAMRGLVPYHQAVINGDWQRDGRFCLNELPIIDLAGKTLGIVGTGNIGKRVTEIARAFGMNVLWAERRGAAPRSPQYTPFDDVFARADIISLHCPLHDAALNAGKLLGYVSDVFPDEPPPADEPLLTLREHPRVLFTPHNAWASVGAQQDLWRILSAQVSAFIAEK